MGAKTKNKSLPQESQKRQLKASTVQTGGNDDDDVCQHELAANEIEMKIARRERADDPRRSSYEAAAAPHYCALLMKSLLLLLLSSSSSSNSSHFVTSPAPSSCTYCRLRMLLVITQGSTCMESVPLPSKNPFALQQQPPASGRKGS